MMESNGKYKELGLARCKSTGLLLLNTTQRMNHVKEPLKCHGPFRSHLFNMTAMTAPADLHCQKVRGFELPGNLTIDEFLREVAKPNESVILLRSSDSGLPEVRGRPLLTQDAGYHFDPDSMQYRDHVGHHPGIICGLLKHKNFFNNMKWMVDEVTKYPNLVVDIFCKSGRHGSVGEATLLAIVLEKLKILFVAVHSEAHERRRGWRTMRCGSGCDDCCGWHDDAGYEAALKDSNLLWTKVLQMMERERAPATILPSRRREIVDLEAPGPSVTGSNPKADTVTELKG